MSGPFKILTCSKCSYQTSDLMLRGHFQYCLSDGRTCGVSRALGWCAECREVRPVEVLGIDESDHHDRADASAKLAELRKPGLIKALFRKSESAQRRIQYWHNRVQDLVQEIEVKGLVYGQRRSPPRCLTCGSTQVSQLPEFPPLEAPHPCGNVAGQMRSPPTKIGFRHPDCGGEILVQPSEAWVRIRIKLRRYDIDGRLLSEEDVDWRDSFNTLLQIADGPFLRLGPDSTK